MLSFCSWKLLIYFFQGGPFIGWWEAPVSEISKMFKSLNLKLTWSWHQSAYYVWHRQKYQTLKCSWERITNRYLKSFLSLCKLKWIVLNSYLQSRNIQKYKTQHFDKCLAVILYVCKMQWIGYNLKTPLWLFKVVLMLKPFNFVPEIERRHVLEEPIIWYVNPVVVNALSCHKQKYFYISWH